MSPTTIHGPDGPLLVQIGEACDDRILPCHKQADLAFGQPLSNADLVERENFMIRRLSSLQPELGAGLVQNSSSGLVKESSTGEIRNRLGYCTSSVVVESAHRSLGVSTYLLAKVKQWLDREGGAALGILYSIKKRVKCPPKHTCPSSELFLENQLE